VVRVPDPLTHTGAFASAIADAAAFLKVDVLVPITDASLLAVLPARERFRGLLPFVDADTHRAVADKDRVLAVARDAGISLPRQFRITATNDPQLQQLGTGIFPVVVKPSRSVVQQEDRAVKVGVSYAETTDELTRVLIALPSAAFPVLLQQRIVGPGVGIFVLLWENRLLAAFAHRRIREKPPSGGVSVYRESIPLPDALLDAAIGLLRHFGWQGVAMVEFKVDASTGTPYLMEINGRFWGSLQLAIDAGVDFATLLVRAASGQRVDPVMTYRTGVRSRWWWGDVDHLVARFRHTDRELALPPDAPSRWRVLRDFLMIWRPGDRNEILRFDDPIPFLRETLDWFRGR
jgi:predicted ATP-grasp superfamily ATP-dependent carboligase